MVPRGSWGVPGGSLGVPGVALGGGIPGGRCFGHQPLCHVSYPDYLGEAKGTMVIIGMDRPWAAPEVQAKVNSPGMLEIWDRQTTV